MDAETLSRIQFGFTIAFHYIFPPLSIGLGLCLVIMEAMYIKTKNRLYEELVKFWVKIFALIFAVGVASGTVMVFAFGNNWANFSRYVGDVFGSALGAEGVFAFFMESGFLGVLLFGWNKVSPKFHFFATIMVCLGAHFSAIWIVVANSWMQTPAGFEIVGEGARAHAVITDFWAMIFNPSSLDRLSHVVVGCWISGAFLVVSVSAFYLLKKRTIPHAIAGLKVGVSVGAIAAVLQFFAGDSSARGVAYNQPAKLAALEGVFQTTEYTPLSLFGYVNSEGEKHVVEIPGLLSFLTFGDPKTPVRGLNEVPKDEWPNVPVVFQTYHLMIAMWGLIVIASAIGLWAWKKRWEVGKWPLRFLVASVFFPQVANEAGWFCAEMGRQPWIVWHVLKTSDGHSPMISADQVWGSLVMFFFLYALLFALFIYLLNHKIQAGPLAVEDEKLFSRNPIKSGRLS